MLFLSVVVFYVKLTNLCFKNPSTNFLSLHFSLYIGQTHKKNLNQQRLKFFPFTQYLGHSVQVYPNIANRIPAATAEPITPATLGPIACMSKKLPGFSS